MSPGGGQESKSAKSERYGDSDFVVVANRLPVDLERLPDGTTAWKRSPGGLVTALEPLLRRRRGAWVGWPGLPSDRDDDIDVDDKPIVQDDLTLHQVPLSTEDVAQYYEGFSNAALWPLYHDVIVKPIYHREWWDRYVVVNRRFAEAAARVAAHGATVWVQDYQLQLVPADAAQAAARPDHRFLSAHPVPADRAVHADALADRDHRGSARRRPGRVPSGGRCAELSDPVATVARRQHIPGNGRCAVAVR